MIDKIIHTVWKNLPRTVRRRVIRTTQAKFTVSAAAVLLNESGEVLLLQHVLRPRKGFGLPGGFLEKNEDPHVAIAREIGEELGIELEDLRLVRVRTLGSHVEFIYSALVRGTPQILAPLEITSMEWFAADSLPASLPPSQRAVVESVLNGDV